MFRRVFTHIFFVLLIFIFTRCGSDRGSALLLVYDQEVPKAATQLIASAGEKGYTIDTINASVRRLGNEILRYRGVVLTGNPGEMSVQWKSDIERYVQSSGGLFVPEVPVNKYQWSWLYQLLKNRDQPYVTEFTSPVSWERIEAGLGKKDIKKGRIKTAQAPDWNRFTRKVLDADVNEPMELAILPSRKILFIEREGNLKLFDPETNATKVLHTFSVSTEGNYEDGMLGITIDPDFKTNNWIYIYYSPYGGHGRQNLSRFYLAYEDSLILSSEKIVLEVPVQRETCCHSGGSITFGPDGNLFLSTGDNTSSKESDGYSPLDERPGRAPFDAQKSSGNTHDLRGKILRITPTDEGSYTIPDGNLFPKNGSEGRPEIFAMGCRNPFRFSVDQKNGWVYWGDVGPDSGKDSELGPRSYDEFNQARTPGNYGWPYFVADNKAYPLYDFETGEIGPTKDPVAPVNNSPNNTGSAKLPPAREAMIWYPYDRSEIWPMLGQGSRSAMAGPVYYTPRGKLDVAFPEYYDGKLFIFEWGRSWIKVVSFDENGDLRQIEPFLPEEIFVKPIDMEFSADGAMYLLEYGANYFANNVEARLVKIEYARGNRLPVPKLAVEKPQGAAPLTTTLSAEGSYDYDKGDSLRFTWQIGDEQIEGKSISYTFNTEGKHPVRLVVTDRNGEEAFVETVVTVGNEPPQIDFEFEGNQSFYFEKDTYDYRVIVTDVEDGSTETGSIKPEDVQVNFNYLEQGFDLALMGEDFFRGQVLNYSGKLLMESSDCNTCHSTREASIGPSYMAVSEKYRDDAGAPEYLAQKVIEGGNGVWGHALMAAHPQHSTEEALEMVNYILSLGKRGVSIYGLEGQLNLTRHPEKGAEGKYVLAVRYTDRGGSINEPATTTRILEIGPPVLEAEQYDIFNNVQQQRPNGGNLAYVSHTADGSFIGFRGLDLAGINEMKLRIRPFDGGIVNIRLGNPDGAEIGELIVDPATGDRPWEMPWQEKFVKLKTPKGIHDIYFVFERPGEEEYLFDLDRIEVLQ